MPTKKNEPEYLKLQSKCQFYRQCFSPDAVVIDFLTESQLDAFRMEERKNREMLIKDLDV